MSEEAPTLAELITTQRGRRSYDDLENDSNGSPKSQMWQRWGSGKVSAGGVPAVPPANDPDQLRLIARVLNVTVPTVWNAIGRSVTLDVGRPDSPFINRLPADLDLLEESDIDFHLTSLNRTLEFRAALKKKSGRNASSGASVTTLRAARTSSGNEYRGARS